MTPVQTARGLAALRAFEAPDIDTIVAFWHDSSDEFLDYMGIDRARLGTREDTRERFRRAIRSSVTLRSPSLSMTRLQGTRC